MKLNNSLILCGVLLMAAGCARVQPIDRPDVAFADHWSYEAAGSAQSVEADWWREFDSIQLNQLIEEALQQSPDLLASAERVRQAELQMRVAGASLFPSLSLGASSGERSTRPSGGTRTESESTSANININYEVDLWGRLAASRSVAQASYRASEYELVAARLSLAGAVANAWFQLLTLEERIAIARENLQISERVMAVVDARYRNGVANAAELSRQQTSLLTQRAAILPLELQERQTRNALAVLLGRTPNAFTPVTEPLMVLTIPAVDAGLPADILVRRPDLARAESQLQAADANLVIARAALLPQVSLSAGAGLATNSLFSLSNATESLSWSASLAQTLFDSGRLSNQRAISESRRIELVEQYRQAILIALQETEDALGRVSLNEAQEQSQSEILVHAERTLRLTEVRYREGSDDLLTLLDAQRSLFQTRDQLAQVRLARLSAAVDLYKAVGGGWQLESQE